MKQELCKAFCGDISVRELPDGLAVSTGFRRRDGDAVGFFVVPAGDGRFRIEDDGLTLPFLMESGVDFGTDTRARALSEILAEYDALYDAEQMTIRTSALDEGDLPRAAMKFVALLIRMGDFLLLSQDHVASTFREDAKKRLLETLGDRAAITENEPVSPLLAEVVPDMVLRAPARPPVALFFGTASSRAYDAIILQMAANLEARIPLSVVVLLESEGVISQELRRRLTNRVASVPVYRQDEGPAIARIAHEVVGVTVH